MVSPTLFHNSVHNAPAGYLSIAHSMRSASINLSAGNESFAIGLLEASTQIIVERKDVLLVAYDNTTPKRLDALRHFDFPLSIALVLSLTKDEHTLGSINVSVKNEALKLIKCFNPTLEPLRVGNCIGAGLPLLEALALGLNTNITLPLMHQNQLSIQVNSV
jgi:hypothetical protein